MNTSSVLQGLQVSIPVNSGVSDTSWFPNIDGPGGLLPVVPSKLISAERLPMIIGNNRDEGTRKPPLSFITQLFLFKQRANILGSRDIIHAAGCKFHRSDSG